MEHKGKEGKPVTFAEKLQAYRKNAGLSQEELAGQLGVSRQSVSKWELNQAYPETGKLIELSRLFGVTVDELLKEGPAPPPTPSRRKRTPVIAVLGASTLLLGLALLLTVLAPWERNAGAGGVSAASSEPRMEDLRRFYFDFARQYRLDYVPYFQRGQAPADSAEYLYFAFAVNLENWGEEKGRMTKEYVEETVFSYFNVSGLFHHSQRKSWDYDGAVYTAWPEGIKPLPLCSLAGCRIWDENGTQLCEITLDFCEPSPETDVGENDGEALRERIAGGNLNGLTVASRETFVYARSHLNFDRPLFLSHSIAEDLP